MQSRFKSIPINWEKQYEQNGEILNKNWTINTEVMKIWSFADIHILRNIDMNMQISDLIMSLPYNSQFYSYRKLEGKNPLFSSKNIIHNLKLYLIDEKIILLKYIVIWGIDFHTL